MCLNFKRASVPYIINDDGLFQCPKCDSILGKLYNVYNDGRYTLQCPNNREYCYRKVNLTEFEAMPYPYITNVKRCNVCDSMLAHTKDLKLVCPADFKHMKPLTTTADEIEKLGYHSID